MELTLCTVQVEPTTAVSYTVIEEAFRRETGASGAFVSVLEAWAFHKHQNSNLKCISRVKYRDLDWKREPKRTRARAGTVRSSWVTICFDVEHAEQVPFTQQRICRKQTYLLKLFLNRGIVQVCGKPNLWQQAWWLVVNSILPTQLQAVFPVEFNWRRHIRLLNGTIVLPVMHKDGTHYLAEKLVEFIDKEHEATFYSLAERETMISYVRFEKHRVTMMVYRSGCANLCGRDWDGLQAVAAVVQRAVSELSRNETDFPISRRALGWHRANAGVAV